MSPIKRSAEDDLVDDSTRKRGKIDVKTDNNDLTKPQKKPFNPLLDETPPVRPACHLFVFGNGDSGQFGLGPDSLGDALRPKIHKWTEDAMAEGKLGGDGGGLAKICAGGMHTLALDESGKVWSWGANDNGALGRITDGVVNPDDAATKLDSDELESTPHPLEFSGEDGFKAVDVFSGDSVSVALSNSGQVQMWGSFRASDGLLGFDGKPGSPQIQHTPMVPPILAKIKFVQVACGTDHVLGLTTQGHVWVWGNGQSGQLGRKIIERRKVNGLAPERLALRRIKTIGTGNYHSFAVDAKGVVYAWGQNTFRQTGIEVDEEVDQSIIWEPTEVKTLHPKVLGMNRRVVQISGGEFHTLFRISDGSVYACGRCHDGELGFGTDHPSMVQKRKDEDRLNYDRAEEAAAKKRKLEEKKRRKSEQGAESESKPAISVDEATSRQKPLILDCIAKPALIDFPCGDKIAQVSAKDRHNLAVSQDGELFSWGSGSTCQLGLGKDEDGNEIETAATPTKVTSKQLEGWKVKAASAGGQHCVILAQRNA